MIHLIPSADGYVAIGDDEFKTLLDTGYFTVDQDGHLRRTAQPLQSSDDIDSYGDETRF
jgi:hypothetical protein